MNYRLPAVTCLLPTAAADCLATTDEVYDLDFVSFLEQNRLPLRPPDYSLIDFNRNLLRLQT
jgi:hypothetical protein